MVDTNEKAQNYAIRNEVNKKPYEARNKVQSMLQDQSIDSLQLSDYIFYFQTHKNLMSNTPENQAFWKEIEFNFVQTYTEETDSDY